ncbi:glycosyltransferase [Photobacterium phosphoreum]|uniref:glycosyltransferase n=1 Tax=Photobacterium phosphoreum TaxID=659 RepID=UPI00242F49C1|nr:glycosyltransferase [Photobacterium phosphoreum]
MKIQVVIPSFYPAVIYGGPIFSTLYVYRELSKLDDIDIFVSTTNTNMYSKLDVKCNEWVSFNDKFNVKYYNETIIDKLSLGLIFNTWKDIRVVDVLHVQSIFNTPTPISLLYGVILRKKIILSPRGSLGSWCLENGNRFKKLWLNLLIKPFVKKITFHATAEQEKREILNIFSNAIVEVIPNGITYSEYQKGMSISKNDILEKFTGIIDEVDKIIISVGRLQKKKGFDILISSFQLVLQEFPNAKLLIAGEDEGEKSNLLKLISKLKLSDSVFLIGAISGQDKIDFYTNADLFVLPSHNENFGNVYVESLAAGTPIVASKNTPWSIVEEYNCGRWVDNTIEENYKAIIEILNKDSGGMQANSKRLAMTYDWSNIAVKFHELYSKHEGIL